MVGLTVPQRDLGLGGVTVRLLDSDEKKLAEETLPATADDGKVTLTHDLAPDEHGEYFIELVGADGMRSPGLGYGLSVQWLDRETLEACQQAQTIEVGQELSATTDGAASSKLEPGCNSSGNAAGEKLFRLELDRPQEVTVAVEPQLNRTDLSVAIRRNCPEPASETACRDKAGFGATESLTRVLGAGSHTLLVEAPNAGDGGPFSVSVEGGYYTRCAPGNAHCADAQTARRCTDDGGRYEAVTCDTTCHPSTGRCVLPDGDRCLDAETINSDSSLLAKFGKFSNVYEIQPGGCLGADDTKTDGPDRSWVLEVPAQTEVTVEAFFPDTIQGSIYLASNCGDIPGTCVAGARDSKDAVNEETLTYTNETDQSQTRFLVVDVGADQKGNDGEVVVNVSYGSQ
ncbi:MAG: hypothetical protein ABEN55_11815 [Bradymonadaceae bacterium]